MGVSTDGDEDGLGDEEEEDVPSIPQILATLKDAAGFFSHVFGFRRPFSGPGTKQEQIQGEKPALGKLSIHLGPHVAKKCNVVVVVAAAAVVRGSRFQDLGLRGGFPWPRPSSPRSSSQNAPQERSGGRFLRGDRHRRYTRRQWIKKKPAKVKIQLRRPRLSFRNRWMLDPARVDRKCAEV